MSAFWGNREIVEDISDSDIRNDVKKDEIDELSELDVAEDEIDELPEVDDSGDDIDNLPDVDDNSEYDESGKKVNGDGKANYDEPTAREIKANGMDERDNPEKTRMEPSVHVIFNCKDKYDKAEFERQVKNQEKGMNNLTLDDFIKNRDNFKENGRDSEMGGTAQEKVRQEARADRIAENRQNGMSRDNAEKEANQWLESQAALHDPDQIAGGDAANVTGMGDKEINSSIGSQWQYRIDAVDMAVQKYITENNLSKEDLKNVYLNVKLEVVSE